MRERSDASTQLGRAEAGAMPDELPPLGLAGLVALVASVQGLATFAALALSTLAPKAAPSFGVGAEMVGYQVSLVYVAAAALSTFAGLFVRRHGAGTISLTAVLIGAAGLVGLASGNLLIATAATLLIGLGYGLTNPAASHLLWRFGPSRHRNLIFALKQTGVPFGGILAALLLPSASEIVGWQGAILTGMLLYLVLALLIARMRRRWDDDRDPGARIQGALLDGMRLAMRDPTLRGISIMGLGYASAQLCLLTFIVTMLAQELGWSLVAAGGMATLMQIGGIAGRVGWSLLAQKIDRGIEVLIFLGVASAACALLMAAATPDWPRPALALLLFVFGLCVVGWNGLYMAEVARASGPKNISVATGAVLVFSFVGIMVAPAMFATIYKLVGSYGTTFGIISLLPLSGAAALVPVLRQGRRGPSAPT
ncbi:MAG: MFS transporter [Hyphomicrobiaceae bacterium]